MSSETGSAFSIQLAKYFNFPFLFFLDCISADPGDLAVWLLHMPHG